LKIFVINLKRELARRSRMKATLSSLGLDFHIIEAVDGSKLEDIYKYFDIKQSIKSINRELSEVEIGVMLSHKEALQNIIINKIDEAIVLEDDVELDSHISSFIKVAKNLKNLDLVLLGHHRKNSRVEVSKLSIWGRVKVGGFVFGVPCEQPMGAYGYYIRKSGAAKLLNSLSSIKQPFDHYTSSFKYLNLKAIQTPIIGIYEEHSNQSSISDGRIKKEKLAAHNRTNILNIWRRVYLALKDRHMKYKEKVLYIIRYFIPMKDY
jgi:glycosyl transferase family 25